MAQTVDDHFTFIAFTVNIRQRMHRHQTLCCCLTARILANIRQEKIQTLLTYQTFGWLPPSMHQNNSSYDEL